MKYLCVLHRGPAGCREVVLAFPPGFSVFTFSFWPVTAPLSSTARAKQKHHFALALTGRSHCRPGYTVRYIMSCGVPRLGGVLQQQGLLMVLGIAFGAKEVCRALQPP
jgi:hypothetical protein